MSLRENEQQHALRNKQKRREKKLQRERRLALDAPLTSLHDDQVLTFNEWVRLNRISERTGRRILDGGDGPTVVTLSPRRIGITIRANREWQQSRERA
jgi:hypothetical protein